MKHLFLILCLLLSTTAFASGKLSVKPMYNLSNQEMYYSGGFSIYERLVGPLAYNGYTGVGETQKHGTWIVSKHAIDFNFGRITVAPTYQMHYATDEGVNHMIGTNLSFQMW